MIIKKTDIPQLILNNITGKIGGVVVRKMYGKTVVSALPIGYKKSNSEQAVRNRKRFAAVSNIATALNKVPEFNEIWKKAAKNKMSSQNAAASYISRQVKKDGTPVITSILPCEASSVNCSIVNKLKTEFSILVDFSLAKDSAGLAKKVNGINPPSNIIYLRVLALFMMRNSDLLPDTYKVICSDFLCTDVSANKAIVTTKFLDSDISKLFNYNQVDVRYVAATYNSQKKVVSISNTHSIDGFF